MAEETQEGKAERLFQNFGKKVDKFLEELNEASGKLNKEFEEKFEDLKQAAEKLKGQVENKDRWKDVEASLKRAGKELENAVKAAFKKKEA
jgi:C4-dicarboxylate-specific signal transduction histidine kinase